MRFALQVWADGAWAARGAEDGDRRSVADSEEPKPEQQPVLAPSSVFGFAARSRARAADGGRAGAEPDRFLSCESLRWRPPFDIVMPARALYFTTYIMLCADIWTLAG